MATRLIIINLQNFMLIMTARLSHLFQEGTGTFLGGKGEEGGVFFPAHTVVCGFSHSYCQGQVHTCERYGKIVSHCALENFKVGC